MRAFRSIAAAQTIPARGDVEANVENHLRLIRAAAQTSVQVLVFPELSLTGYELDLAPELAFTEDDPRLAPLTESASTHSMTLIVGAPVRMGPRLHIGAFILAPDRSLTVYTKHHLGAFPADADPAGVVPPAEATIFSPGRSNPLVRLGGGTAAVAVCADTGHPAHAREAAERGATSYLASMFVVPRDFATEIANLEACAVQHGMAVVFANYGGPSGGLASAGCSAIWSDKGELLARLEARGTGVAFAFEDETGWHGSAVMIELR